MNKIKNLFNKLKDIIKNHFHFINKKNKFNTMETLVLMIISSIFGMFAGGVIMYGKGALNTGIKKELNEFVDTYTEILNDYYKEVDSDKLLEAGISGMINYLGDPYSVYMDEEESEAFLEKVNGEYVGIGTEIIQYGDLRVEINEAFSDGPAYKAGIRKGDILIKVDNKDITNMSLTEISNLVKGKKGTIVKMTIKREEQEMTFDVKRDNIDIVSVASKLIEYNDSKIGYLGIEIFASNTASQFEDKLEELEKEKIDSLIIDVRGNSGGYLSIVTEILSLFLEKDDIIYQLKTKDEIEKITDKSEESRDYKIAVLINGGSASASEVLATSLMENKNAISVGTTSYGKSKVQKTQELSSGGSIKYTFQEWLTPKGESVDSKGIKPTHELTYEASLEEGGYDTQLQKTLDLLTEEVSE